MKGEGGDAEPAMEMCWSMFMSTSASSGEANDAGELPLLESVSTSGVSKRAGGGA